MSLATIEDIAAIIDNVRCWFKTEDIVTYKGEDGTQVSICRSNGRRRVEVMPGTSVHTYFVKATEHELMDLEKRILAKESYK